MSCLIGGLVKVVQVHSLRMVARAEVRCHSVERIQVCVRDHHPVVVIHAQERRCVVREQRDVPLVVWREPIV
jgi:hypothetical protein